MYTEQLLKYTNIAIELEEISKTYKWYEFAKKLAIKRLIRSLQPFIQNEIKTFNKLK